MPEPRNLLSFFVASLLGTASGFTVNDIRRRSSGSILQAEASSKGDRISDEQALEALERLEAIDAKLGVGVGASKERAKLNAILEQREENSQTEDDGVIEDDEDFEEGFWDDTKFIPKHSPGERVAIFGGDPARRRQTIEKRLAPYQTLDQFGTPRDVGPSDTSRLLQKISSRQYDVVYLWTRFNCHASRSCIRQACVETGTRFYKVESLAFIR